MAEGFCYVNDLAFVAKQLIDRGLTVAVIDIDAHHGNGTQDIFYEEPRVLTVSFHESGKTLYPWGGEADEIGEGPGRGYNVNIPLPMSSDDEIFLFAFNEITPPLLRAFAPDVVFGVMGVDTFSTDPLTHLKLTNNSYSQAARALHKLSPRWIALGAGGYNMDNVSRGYALLWATVHGLDQEDDLTSTLGGAMLGEADLGVASLRDAPFRTSGPEKEQALAEVEKSVDYIMDNVFPILGAG
jgi:acetoin utilization protein AcuC